MIMSPFHLGGCVRITAYSEVIPYVYVNRIGPEKRDFRKAQIRPARLQATIQSFSFLGKVREGK